MPAWEYAAIALGAIIVIATIVYLVAKWRFDRSSPSPVDDAV